MKYKELPSEKLVQKLLATSFESPSANRKVYTWAQSILPSVRFLENERVKLVKKYGKEDGRGGISVTQENQKVFNEKYRDLLEMDIEEELKECPIKEDWFDDYKCSYPKEKDMWLTPNEIGFFVSMSK